ncbi:MAG TPA: hypothetical protein VK668_09090 [Mucilaginibacter sp.]|nr:hypothetical protein [Mucilaginibacter sp.]
MNHSDFDYPEIYNGLQDVIVADEKLSAMGRNEMLSPLCQTIMKYHLEDTVGIRLLHNHNQISQNEVMLEKEEVDDKGAYCLTTVAVDGPGNIGFPNSWKLENGRYFPLEFSTDPLVMNETDKFIGKEDFMTEFNDNLEMLGVTNILGPCVLGRMFYEKRKPLEQEVLLVEITDEKRRANILKYYPSNEIKVDKLIQTVWMATAGKDYTENISLAEAMQTCTPICTPVALIHCDPNDDGTHSRTVTYSHSKGHETVNP